MPQANADIVGKAGSNFIATLDSGAIVQAQLAVVGQAPLTLAIGADQQSVTVPSLPAGDSTIWLALVWAPGVPNANIGVGTVTSGNAQAQNPPGIVYDNNPVGVIQLFGS